TLGPDGTVRDGEGLLVRIAKLARTQQASAWAAPAFRPPLAPGAGSASASALHPVVALGASTGGPDALARILTGLPGGFPASVVVIQHIAADFAPSLARWLQAHSTLPVRVAREGDVLKAGEILLAGTDDHLILRPDRCLAYTTDPADYPYRPSIDVFFNSLAA